MDSLDSDSRHKMQSEAKACDMGIEVLLAAGGLVGGKHQTSSWATQVSASWHLLTWLGAVTDGSRLAATSLGECR